MAKAILVADDDPDILSIVSMSLETQGYTVYKAANGREAVDLARQHHPDLVLMDMMMPIMDGLAACQAMRALEKKDSRVPILFLTARDTRHDQMSSSLSGGDDFISKPISLQELRERVEAALSRSKRKPS